MHFGEVDPDDTIPESVVNAGLSLRADYITNYSIIKFHLVDSLRYLKIILHCLMTYLNRRCLFVSNGTL